MLHLDSRISGSNGSQLQGPILSSFYVSHLVDDDSQNQSYNEIDLGDSKQFLDGNFTLIKN